MSREDDRAKLLARRARDGGRNHKPLVCSDLDCAWSRFRHFHNLRNFGVLYIDEFNVWQAGGEKP